MQQVSTLHADSILDALTPEARHELAAVVQPIELTAGAVIFQEGERGDSACLILDGEVEIIKALDTAEERLIRVQGAGGLVGEMALLDRAGLRTATVRSLAPVRLAVLSRADFDALMLRRPELALELVRLLVVRLRDADNTTIHDLREKNRQLEQAYRELQAAQAQIIEKERLERELQLAREMQQSILLRQLPTLPGYDFGAVMAPARAVGGDFFDFILLDRDHVGIVIADVSDKGMPAAIFMALTRSLLRAEASRGASPAEVLNQVNYYLLDMSDSRSFVTVLYGILHRQTGEFRYARAGHELPLVFDAAGHEIAVQRGPGQFLGLFSNPKLDEQTITIPAGGQLVLVTDGVTDAVDESNSAFGEQRLRAALVEHRAMPAQVLCQQVMDIVAEHRGSAPQFDDITLVVAKPR